MRYTAKASRFGDGCILIPGRHQDPDGFVNFEGQPIEGIHGRIEREVSVTALRRAAQLIPEVGLVPAADFAAVKEQLDRSEAELIETNAEVVDLRAKLERINGLQKDGFKVVRQQGRPPVKTKVAG